MMTLEEIISNAEDNAHAVWISEPESHDGFEDEDEFTECMVQNAIDDFVSV